MSPGSGPLSGVHQGEELTGSRGSKELLHGGKNLRTQQDLWELLGSAGCWPQWAAWTREDGAERERQAAGHDSQGTPSGSLRRHSRERGGPEVFLLKCKALPHRYHVLYVMFSKRWSLSADIWLRDRWFLSKQPWESRDVDYFLLLYSQSRKQFLELPKIITEWTSVSRDGTFLTQHALSTTKYVWTQLNTQVCWLTSNKPPIKLRQCPLQF